MIKKTSVKLIAVLAALITVFTAALLPAAAYGGAETATIADTETPAADETTAENTEAHNTDTEAAKETNVPSANENGKGDDKGTGDGESGDGNVDSAGTSGTIFGEIYAYLASHAGEIFSTLSFIGTLAVAIAYKRGLIPLLRDGLGAIGGAAGSISTSTEQARAVTEEAIAGVRKALDGFSDTLSTIERAGEETSERLRALESEGYDKKALTKILLEQINMLSDIFMSTSLPQFRKDEIAERAKEMRDLVAAVGEGAEEK